MFCFTFSVLGFILYSAYRNGSRKVTNTERSALQFFLFIFYDAHDVGPHFCSFWEPFAALSDGIKNMCSAIFEVYEAGTLPAETPHQT